MRGNVALCAADNSDRFGASGLVAQNFAWKLMKIGFMLPQCAICMRYSLQYRRRPLRSVISHFLHRCTTRVKPGGNEMLRVGGKVLAITGFTPNACNSVLLIACIPLPKNKRQTVFNLCLSRAGNVNGFAVHCAVQQDLELAPERIRHSEALVKNWSE